MRPDTVFDVASITKVFTSLTLAALVDRVRAGDTGAGMAAAVGAIGAILAEHLPKDAANPNELPDGVIEL